MEQFTPELGTLYMSDKKHNPEFEQITKPLTFYSKRDYGINGMRCYRLEIHFHCETLAEAMDLYNEIGAGFFHLKWGNVLIGPGYSPYSYDTINGNFDLVYETLSRDLFVEYKEEEWEMDDPDNDEIKMREDKRTLFHRIKNLKIKIRDIFSNLNIGDQVGGNKIKNS